MRVALEDFHSSPIAEILTNIAHFFDRCGCVYWVDSGTLLSVHRDNNVSLDDDFDISVCGEMLDVQLLKEFLIEKKYYVNIYEYAGTAYKIKITNDIGIIIDLNIFQDVGGMFCCPQKIRPAFFHLIPSILKGLYSSFKSKMSAPRSLSVRKMKDGASSYFMGSWLVPKKFVGSNRVCPALGLKQPENTEAYLLYRYGAWRIPAKKWNFAIDDSGLTYLSPRHIAEIYQAIGRGGLK